MRQCSSWLRGVRYARTQIQIWQLPRNDRFNIPRSANGCWKIPKAHVTAFCLKWGRQLSLLGKLQIATNLVCPNTLGQSGGKFTNVKQLVRQHFDACVNKSHIK
jgi:hypothetical protein